jgi:lipase maturation factor 1
MAEASDDRPVMLYDGKCAFCRRWVGRWQSMTGDAVRYEPFQEVGEKIAGIDALDLGRAVHLVESDGSISRGAKAVFRALEIGGSNRWLKWAYERVDGFKGAADAIYGTVSAHREAADRIDLLLIGPGTEATTYRLTRQIFLRLLGAVYVIAFVSLWVQIDGLIGSPGILPTHSYLDEVAAYLGADKFWRAPTLCWFNSSDAFLHGLCAAGTVAGGLIILGLVQLPALVAAFLCYLSLAIVGQDFLEFQWDSLLLEAGFIAIFFSPPRIWAGWGSLDEPSRAILWLTRWLVFRVMFMSGVVKLASGDVSWRALTAMRFHYETQPLPTWTSWYFFQLSTWFQTFSCVVVFMAELGVPLLIFTPRRPRILAFWGIAIFQSLIAATGNYGFFNLLTVVLCCVLPDDAFWRWLFRRSKPAAIVRRGGGVVGRWAMRGVAALLFLISVPYFVGAFGVEAPNILPLRAIERWTEPWRIVNGYGLFAIMTTTRPQLTVEGSDDGVNWKEYVFKWNPGDVNRRPEFMAPHMPRLDWQMWFAALGDESSNPWIANFLARLLDGSPAVLGLLQSNPFPDHPPRFVRAVLYDYRFTNRQIRRETGAWWVRERTGVYYQLQRD